MALKHDSQGFLVGDQVDVSDQIDIWKDIKSDVAAIKQLLARMVRPAADAASPGQISTSSSQPDGKPVEVNVQVNVQVDVRSAGSGVPGAAAVPGGAGGTGGTGAAGGSARIALRDERGRFAKPASRQIAMPNARGVGADKPSAIEDGAGGVGSSTERAPADISGSSPGTQASAVPASTAVSAGPGRSDGAGTGDLAGGSAVNPGPKSPTAAKTSAKRVAEPSRRSVAPTATRDANGRFIKGAGGAGGTGGEGGAGRVGGEARSDSRLLSAIGSLSDAVLRSGSGMEDADPTVKALNEVAQPIARGWDLVSGMSGGTGNKRQEGWLRRIFSELKVFRKEETTYSKTSERRLKAIEEKPGDGGDSDGGSIFKLLFGFLAKLPLLGGILSGLVAILSKVGGGLLGKVLGGLGAGALAARKGGPASVTPATAAGQRPGIADAAGALPTGGGKPVPGAQGGGLRRAAAKVGSRIPVLGALVALGMGAFEARATEGDDSLSREQKNVEHSKTAGGVVGGLSGAAAGAAIGSVIPVVGTVIGGILGAVLGDWLGREGGRVVGENLNRITAAASSVWESIKSSASSVWDGLRSGWDSSMAKFSSFFELLESGWNTSMAKLSSFAESAKSGWESVTRLFRSAYEGLKSLPVIGSVIQAAEDAVTKAKEKVVEGGAKVADGARAAVGAAKDAVTEAGGKAIDTVKAGAGYLAKNTNIGKGVKAAVDAAPKVAAAAKRAYDVTAASAGSALEAVMPKGYRHKALFDGIIGGDSLSKNGSYTNEEAAKIRELKIGGANTSANVPGGMSLEVQDKISAQAKKAGLDPVMMQKIAAMESGGNANAVSSTGAIGIYQFTGKTASGVGIKNRFDADQNIEGGMKLTRQNQAVLEKSGLPVTAENLYMMHQLGPRAAQEVIRGASEGKSKADMSPETQQAMNLNYGANSKTAADHIATNRRALDDRYASVTKEMPSTEKTAAAQAQQPAAGGVPRATPAANSPAGDGSVKVASARPVAAQSEQVPSGAKQGVTQPVVAQRSETAVTSPSIAGLPTAPEAFNATTSGSSAPAPGAADAPQKARSTPSAADTSVVATASASAPTLPKLPAFAAPSVVASVQVPSVQPAGKPIQIPDAPPAVVSMASSSQSSQQVVRQVQEREVGQDVADRRIAHIVTGGLSGGA